jgi:hypothetical protein
VLEALIATRAVCWRKAARNSAFVNPLATRAPPDRTA